MTTVPVDRGLCDRRYRLERVLGRGPFGVVYQATDVDSGADRALKRLYAHHHDPQVLSQVKKDGLIAAAVNHPGILAPDATGFDEDDAFYLTEDRVIGESLQARLSRGPLPLPEALRFFEPLCAALHAAHKVGLFHGDLTPGNVLLPETPPGGSAGTVRARVTDFGMCHLGAAGTWSGAAAYQPPEVYRGEGRATARGDVFALGALLFECLSGRRLFDGPTAAAVMYQICIAPSPPLSALLPDGVSHIERVLAMACARDPAARFDNPAALWRALQAVLSAPPAPRRPPPPLHRTRKTPTAPLLIQATTTDPGRQAQSTLERWLQGEGNDEPTDQGDRPGDRATVASPLLGPLLRPRYRLVASAALGAVAMSATLFFAAGLTGHLHKPSLSSFSSAPEPATPAPSASSVAAVPVSAPPQDGAALLSRARAHLAAADYLAACSDAEAALRLRPGDPAARDLLREATDGLRMSAVLKGFQRAAQAGELDTAMALHGELPQGSPFRAAAAADFERIRPLFEQAHLNFADAALKIGLCQEVDRQADELRRLGGPQPGGALPNDGALFLAQEMARDCHGQRHAAQTQKMGDHRDAQHDRDTGEASETPRRHRHHDVALDLHESEGGGLDGMIGPSGTGRGARQDLGLKDPFGSGSTGLRGFPGEGTHSGE